MLKKDITRLLIILVIGFATIFIFSSLKAQGSAVKKKSVEDDLYLISVNPSDVLYDGLWLLDRVSYGWNDSLKKVFTDSLFSMDIPLIGKAIGRFFTPIDGSVTSPFGMRRYRYHYGTDINLNTGDTVVTAFDGRIRMARYHNGYGNMVVVRHDNGLETVYGHFSKILVDTNQYVKAGDPIGLGGNTGRSYGSHLHFEVRYLGVPVNPEMVVDFTSGKLLDDTIKLSSKYFSYLRTVSGSGSPALAKYHKVKQGDCLSAIAHKHGTSVSRLCQMNNISRTTTLRIGRSLRIR